MFRIIHLLCLAALAILSGCRSLPQSAVPGCRVVGEAPIRDLERAQAACTTARARYQVLFARPAPQGTLVVKESRDFAWDVENGSWVLDWQSSKAFLEEAAVRGSAADVADHWTATLPHEIGHMLLAADFFPGGLPNALHDLADSVGAGQRYGTPLPDWFDEAVAIWMEPDSVRQGRLVEARRNLDEVPPIRTLISIEHPLRENEAGRRETVTLYPCPRAEVCPDRPRWNEGVRITTGRDRMGQVHADTTYFQGMPPARDPTEEHFYPLALGALQYLLDRGGKGAIAALEDRLRTNPNSSEILLGLPGLPSETNALEEDWQSWWRRDLEQGSPDGASGPNNRLHW